MDSKTPSKPSLSGLPRVDRVAAHPNLSRLRLRLGAELLTRLTRRAIDDARSAVLGGATRPTEDEVAKVVERAADRLLLRRARPVINATGVILHTNLGRAPLGERAVKALAESAGRYTSIEIDLESGRRGARGAFAESALSHLSGSESALVVNNNAAAVLLSLSALAFGGRVLVSRGELVEIGGGFRIPDVLLRSGARMIEVGTTNKTRLDDYKSAFEDGGAVAILRVHQANFKQIGFVERPDLRGLADLAHSRGALLIKDLGGGAMLDLSPFGLVGEPTVRSSITEGADIVCFSTDKVLGGPQGGAIVGRSPLIEKARRDPLARALRLGRLPLIALEATLGAYLEGDLDGVPAVAAVRTPLDVVAKRAYAWRDALNTRGVCATIVELSAAMGGGSLAEEPLASIGLAIEAPEGASVETLAHRLRTGEPPVLARIHEGRLLLDARTVLPSEDFALLDAVERATIGDQQGKSNGR